MCQRSFPVRASKAIKLPSESPANTNPPAVESVPPFGDEKYLNCHCSCPVKGSMASRAPEGLSPGFAAYTLPMKSRPARYFCGVPVNMSHRSEEHTSELQSHSFISYA